MNPLLILVELFRWALRCLKSHFPLAPGAGLGEWAFPGRQTESSVAAGLGQSIWKKEWLCSGLTALLEGSSLENVNPGFKSIVGIF